MTIFEELRTDHDAQRTLLDLLTKSEGDSDGRRELFERLRWSMSDHAAAEERYFYAPLMEVDLTQDQARHSVAEHQELEEYLDRLDELDFSSPQWLKTAKDLWKRLVHHLDEEETEVFPVAGKALDAEHTVLLGDEYRADMHRRADQRDG